MLKSCVYIHFHTCHIRLYIHCAFWTALPHCRPNCRPLTATPPLQIWQHDLDQPSCNKLIEGNYSSVCLPHQSMESIPLQFCTHEPQADSVVLFLVILLVCRILSKSYFQPFLVWNPYQFWTRRSVEICVRLSAESARFSPMWQSIAQHQILDWSQFCPYLNQSLALIIYWPTAYFVVHM